VELIIDEAFRALAEVGILVENAEALDLFAAAGARIAADRKRVFLPRQVCETCIASVPRQFTLYDRDGEQAFQVGGEGVHFNPGSAATLVYDFADKRIRKPATCDVIQFVRVTEALAAMDAQSTAIVPADVPQEVADRYRLFLALVYGRKPVITGTFSGDAFASMYEMLVAVRGSSAAVAEQPLVMFDCCPTSPLTWSDLSGQTLIECARSGVPAQVIPAPLLGATSPVTLSGTLVQHTAENLSGIVLHQTAAPAAPLVYGGAAAVLDMRSGSASMSAVEAVMVDAGSAQIGRSLALPVQSYMGLSDAKLPDMQAGFETTLGAVMAALAGVNIVSGAGMLNYVNCQSLEKLVMDAEICSHAQRLLEGIGIRGELAGLDIIGECAVSSAFLTSEHTRRHFRQEIHHPNAVVDRVSQSEWESAGSQTAGDRAHEMVAKILDSQEYLLPPKEITAALESIMSRDAAAAGADALPVRPDPSPDC
jgi:trimethylamine--corrinoid protein Co-methyltransferase